MTARCTDFDSCVADGRCSGVDLCASVTCAVPNQCQSAVQCFRGNCPALPVRSGVTCNDGPSNTDDDVCGADAVCRGTDYCALCSVTCPAPTRCRLQCARGVCAANPNKADRTSCDDGREATDNDRCVSGVCRGELLCVKMGITCPEPYQCHTVVACAHGWCAALPAKIDGVRCDDGVLATVNNQCIGGACLGEDLCATRDVTCAVPPPADEHQRASEAFFAPYLCRSCWHAVQRWRCDDGQ